MHIFYFIRSKKLFFFFWLPNINTANQSQSIAGFENTLKLPKNVRQTSQSIEKEGWSL
jgi:hypothetical protein